MSRRSVRNAAGCAVVAALHASGCVCFDVCGSVWSLAGSARGSDGTFRDHRYTDAHVAYEVGDPGAGWVPVTIETCNAAWHQPASGAALLVNSHCEGVQDAPLEGLTAELLMGTTERDIEQQTRMPFAGREALETIATAKLDGVPRKRAIFVLKKDGCVYDIVYDAPPAHFDDGLPSFRRVRDGLVVGPRRDRG